MRPLAWPTSGRRFHHAGIASESILLHPRKALLVRTYRHQVKPSSHLFLMKPWTQGAHSSSLTLSSRPLLQTWMDVRGRRVAAGGRHRIEKSSCSSGPNNPWKKAWVFTYHTQPICFGYGKPQCFFCCGPNATRAPGRCSRPRARTSSTESPWSATSRRLSAGALVEGSRDPYGSTYPLRR